MRKTTVGLIAGLTSLGVSTATLATDTANQPNTTTTTKQETTTTTMKSSDMSDHMSATPLNGRVIKTDQKTVWVDQMGAIVPLKIDRDTRFDGPALKGANDLKEGQEIRVTFLIKDRTDNVARTIALSTTPTGTEGIGGSGLDKRSSGTDTDSKGSTSTDSKGSTSSDTTSPKSTDKKY